MSFIKRLAESQQGRRRSAYGLASGRGRQTSFDNDPAAFRKYNADVTQWAEGEADDLKYMLKRQGSYRTGKLYRSIRAKIYKTNGVVTGIGFNIRRYGVFVEKGVNRYYPITSSRSSQLAKPWFNKTLNPALEELLDIAREHYVEIAVKSIRMD
jgi:hypothetical protein